MQIVLSSRGSGIWWHADSSALKAPDVVLVREPLLFNGRVLRDGYNLTLKLWIEAIEEERLNG